jgi:GNAT superfamily N-acetyltransferase
MATLTTELAKIKKAYIEGGVPLILRRTIKRFFRKNSAWWFIRDLSLPLREFPSPFNMNVMNRQGEEVINYMKRKDYISDNELIVGRQEGHSFFGLFVNEEVKGFCKCGYRRVYVNDFREIITMPDSTAFIYEYEIDETLRGKGVGKYFISTILKKLKDNNWKYVICHIPPWNIPSIKVMEACGFKRLELVRFVEFAGLKWKSKSIKVLLNIAVTNGTT